MLLKILADQFKAWETTNKNPLTLDECIYILMNEGNELFYSMEYSDVYSSVMEYRDYLELEEGA